MNNLTTQQILTTRRILDKYRNHSVSIRSSAYKEIEEIIDLLTEALVS